MEIREKIDAALRESITVHFLELDEDDGISGYVVSPRFENMRSLERQKFIDQMLSGGSHPLTRAERRQIVMIAALTPAEFGTKSDRPCVDKLLEVNSDLFKIELWGGVPAGNELRALLDRLPGIETSEPQPIFGSDDQMFLMARRQAGSQLTREAILAFLEDQSRINPSARSESLSHPA